MSTQRSSSQSVSDAYGIDPRYDSPETYGKSESHYGNGKYPPDWDGRREAVWSRQKYWCGRCQRYKGDLEHSACHHVRPLSEGGSNELANLVGLCGSCHCVMPPDDADTPGSAAEADRFPAAESDLRVATVNRRGVDSAPLDHDLRALSTETRELDRDEWSAWRSSVCYNIPPGHARNLGSEDGYLASTLTQNGIVPRTDMHNQLHVATMVTGIKAPFTTAAAQIVSGGGAAYETALVNQTQSTRDGYESVITTTPGSSSLTLSVGAQHTRDDQEVPLDLDPSPTQQVTFTETDRTKAVELRLPAPPLTRHTAVGYLTGVLTQVGITVGIVSVALLLVTAVTSLPRSPVTYGGVVVVTIAWIGLKMSRAASRSPGATVSDLRR